MSRTDRELSYIEFAASRRDQLRRIAYGMCGDWHQADDLVQNALIKLYIAWPRVVRGGQEDAYVRKILLNAAIDDSRRPSRRERATEDLPEVAAPVSTAIEDQASLVAALQLLPGQQRATVLLRHWLGLSVGETASELGIAEGTVKSHCSRGLEALRGAMTQAGSI